MTDTSQVSLTDAEAGATALSRYDHILQIPVTVHIIIGSTVMPVQELMKLGRGAVIHLDQRVGDPVEIVVNGRSVARGEMVVEQDASRIGVCLTEIVGTLPGH